MSSTADVDGGGGQAKRDDEIEIQVTDHTSTFKMKIRASHSAAEIKAIVNAAGIPVDGKKLVFNGKDIADEDAVALTTSIVDGDTIDIVPGDPPNSTEIDVCALIKDAGVQELFHPGFDIADEDDVVANTAPIVDGGSDQEKKRDDGIEIQVTDHTSTLKMKILISQSAAEIKAIVNAAGIPVDGKKLVFNGEDINDKDFVAISTEIAKGDTIELVPVEPPNSTEIDGCKSQDADEEEPPAKKAKASAGQSSSSSNDTVLYLPIKNGARTLQVMMEAGDRVADLQVKLTLLGAKLPEKFVFTFNGVIMDEERTFRSYGVPKYEAKIEIVKLI